LKIEHRSDSSKTGKKETSSIESGKKYHMIQCFREAL